MTVATEDELALAQYESEFDLPPIICSGRQCEHEGVALIKYRDHEECRAHYLWYVACQKHLDLSVEHKCICERCKLHLNIAQYKYL